MADAPPLELIRAFANTLDVEESSDELRDPGALAAWLGAAGLTEGPVRVAAADLDRARALRDAVRALLLHHNGGEAPERVGEVLDRQAARSRVRLSFGGRSVGPGLRVESTGVDGALGRILAAIAETTTDGSWERLKLCRADDCRWAFVDGSRNGSRHWCSMQVCGNREKARAHRARSR